MAYYYEETIRQPLFRDISNMAQALGVTVVFDDVDAISISALQQIHNDLLSRFQSKQFDAENDEILDEIEATIEQQNE